MRGLIIPSYSQGFARYAAESKYPGLWRGLVSILAPSLGPTGLILHDLLGRNDGVLTSMEVGTDWVISEGKYGLEFDTGEYVDVGASPVLNFTTGDSFSIVMRIKPVPDNGFQFIVSRDNSGAGTNSYGIAIANNNAIYMVNDTGWTIADAAIIPGITYCVAGVWTAGTPYLLDLYIDGILQVTAPGATSNNLTAGGNLNLGRRPSAPNQYYGGVIHDILFYNRVLIHNEIAEISAGASPLTPKRRALGYVAPVGGVAPTGVFYGPVFGPLGGPM